MPVVFREGGYRFFFYSNEGDPQEPVHVHVRGDGKEAKIWIEPTISIAQSHGMTAKELNTVLRTVETKAILIKNAWHEHFSD